MSCHDMPVGVAEILHRYFSVKGVSDLCLLLYKMIVRCSRFFFSLNE